MFHLGLLDAWQVINGYNNTVGNSTLVEVGIIEELLGNMYFNMFSMGCLAVLISVLFALFIQCSGPVVGGILGTVPTTIVPSTLGFAITTMMSSTTLSIDAQQRAIVRSFFTVPIGNFITLFFLLCWKIIPKPLDSWVIRRYRNSIARKLQNLMESDQVLRQVTVELGNGTVNLELNEYFVSNSSNDTLVNSKIQRKLRNNRFKLKIFQFLGSDGFVRVLSGTIVLIISMVVLFSLAGCFIGLSELIHWPEEVTVVLGSLCFVAKVLVGVAVNWRCNKFKTLKTSKPKISLKQRISNCRVSSLSVITFLLKIVIPFSKVSLVIYLKKQSLITIAGLLAAFPAIYATTLFTVWIGNEDPSLAVDAASPMILGSSSVSLYAMIACPLMIYWNIFGGAAVAYITAVICVNIPSFFYLRWRSREEEIRKLEIEKNQAIELSFGNNEEIMNQLEYTRVK